MLKLYYEKDVPIKAKRKEKEPLGKLTALQELDLMGTV